VSQSQTNQDRTTQLAQLQTIARSLNSIALTRLLRFAEGVQQQSQGKGQQRAKRRERPVVENWRIGE